MECLIPITFSYIPLSTITVLSQARLASRHFHLNAAELVFKGPISTEACTIGYLLTANP